MVVLAVDGLERVPAKTPEIRLELEREREGKSLSSRCSFVVWRASRELGHEALESHAVGICCVLGSRFEPVSRIVEEGWRGKVLIFLQILCEGWDGWRREEDAEGKVLLERLGAQRMGWIELGQRQEEC